MGIYNRDYYRDGGARGARWSLDGITPVVKYLILANVAVFLPQIFVVREISVRDMLKRYNPEIDKILTAKHKHSKNRDKDKQDTEQDEDDAFSSLPGFMQRISIIQEWFELDTNKVIYQGQVWRLLT